nr:hypothetical protein [Tanacetum cinerariifolium]
MSLSDVMPQIKEGMRVGNLCAKGVWVNYSLGRKCCFANTADACTGWWMYWDCIWINDSYVGNVRATLVMVQNASLVLSPQRNYAKIVFHLCYLAIRVRYCSSNRKGRLGQLGFGANPHGEVGARVFGTVSMVLGAQEDRMGCWQDEQGVPLQAEQYDWLVDTDEEVDEQELEAHYSYMAKIQEVPNADSGTDSEPVEQNEQNDVEGDDEHVALANLIANLKLDVDENKNIQKQLKKANTTLAQELKECKTILAETSKSLGESISVRDSCLVALQTKQTEFEKYKAFNDRTVDYDKLE